MTAIGVFLYVTGVIGCLVSERELVEKGFSLVGLVGFALIAAGLLRWIWLVAP